MPAASIHDRFFTPKVGRALVSPWSILLLAAVTTLALIVGASVIAAIAIGVAAYIVRILLAMRQDKPRRSRIDPFVLSEPWRRHVQSAQSAKLRFDRAVSGMRDGPIRQRLAHVSEHLQLAIDEAWEVASRGDDIDAALAQLDTRKAEAELQRLTSSGHRRPEDEPTIDALTAQIDSGRRMEKISASARERLQFLDARFNELVARAIEVSLGTADSAALGNDVALANDVEGLITELEGVRLALEDVRDVPLGDVTAGDVTAGDDTAGDDTTEPPDEQKPQTRPPR